MLNSFYYLPVNMFIEFVPVRFRINLAETEINQKIENIN